MWTRHCIRYTDSNDGQAKQFDVIIIADDDYTLDCWLEFDSPRFGEFAHFRIDPAVGQAMAAAKSVDFMIPPPYRQHLIGIYTGVQAKTGGN